MDGLVEIPSKSIFICHVWQDNKNLLCVESAYEDILTFWSSFWIESKCSFNFVALLLKWMYFFHHWHSLGWCDIGCLLGFCSRLIWWEQLVDERTLCELSVLIGWSIQSRKRRKKKERQREKEKQKERWWEKSRWRKRIFYLCVCLGVYQWFLCLDVCSHTYSMCVWVCVCSESHWLCIDEAGAVIYSCWSRGE